MHYYKRMLFTFCSIAFVYTLLIAGVFLGGYASMESGRFQRDAQASLQQLGEYADARFQAVFSIHAILRASEYSTDYLQESPSSPDRYARLQLANFVRRLYGITATQMNSMAVTKLNDDYAMFNDSTGDIDYLQSVLHLNDADLDALMADSRNGRSRQMRFLHVTDNAGRPMLVIVKWEWMGRPLPLFIFTSFYKEQLIQAEALQGGTFVLLYEDEIMACAGQLGQQQAAAALADAGHGGLALYQGQSSVSGVRYAYLVRRPGVVTPVFGLILLAGLLACAAGIYVMFTITRRMYTPIAGVLSTAGGSVDSGGDEFTHIQQTLVALHSDVEAMSRSLERNNATLKVRFLRDLLLGMLTREQAREGVRQFLLPGDAGPLAAVMVRYRETAELETDFSHNMTLETKQRLAVLLEAVFQGRGFYQLVDMNYSTQALIVPEDNSEALAEALRVKLLSVEPKYGLEITAFIGAVCAGLDSVGESYREAVRLAEACEFSVLNSKVVTAADVRQSSGFSIYYPIGAEQSILNAIIHGKTTVWQAALDDIIRTNQAQRQGNIAHLPLMLTATVNRILDGLDPKHADGLPERSAVYPELRSCRTYEELRQKALELFGALAAVAQRSHEASTGGIATRMLDYVHNNYAKDISLFSLADHMNLSQSYVSSLFKNATGRNFKDYVSEYRYQTACTLLKSNPNMRIKDVAERVGCNAGSLSRLFERYAGMTPGAYQVQLGGR